MGKGTAVITGATGGIGSIFARRLAERGLDLLLIARDAAALEALSRELGRVYGVSAGWLAVDLATPEGIGLAEKRVGAIDDLEILVNAAGFGTAGRFSRCDLATQVKMIELHVTAPTRLCHAALGPMLARQRGAIINIASILATVPLPGNVTYAGSKSYLVAFSQTLQQEVKRSGIRVQALCPGLTRTPFHHTPQYSAADTSRFPPLLWGEAESVVDASLAALKRGQVVCIPGLANKALALSFRMGLGGLALSIFDAAQGNRH